jgi:peptidoglycan hydrolase-like protein with peptidoglycan-binding domain
VREIQTALQREGYLQNEPSGQYDRATVEAMTSYQKANNMRSTGYPTAESLQRLGLSRQRRVNPPAAPGENRPDSNTTGSQSSSQLRDQQN